MKTGVCQLLMLLIAVLAAPRSPLGAEAPGRDRDIEKVRSLFVANWCEGSLEACNPTAAAYLGYLVECIELYPKSIGVEDPRYQGLIGSITSELEGMIGRPIPNAPGNTAEAGFADLRSLRNESYEIIGRTSPEELQAEVERGRASLAEILADIRAGILARLRSKEVLVVHWRNLPAEVSDFISFLEATAGDEQPHGFRSAAMDLYFLATISRYQTDIAQRPFGVMLADPRFGPAISARIQRWKDSLDVKARAQELASSEVILTASVWLGTIHTKMLNEIIGTESHHLPPILLGLRPTDGWERPMRSLSDTFLALE